MNKLKKFMVVMFLCTLCTACGTNNEQQATDNPQTETVQKVSQSKPVAIIENYEEVAGDIVIQRASGTPNGAEALLYPDDKITGKLDNVKIQCTPYAEFQTKDGAYIISYDPPSGIGEIAYNVIDYASAFWNNVESVNTAASRGSDDDLNLNPKPGFNVTLLQNQPVTFAWDSSASNFYIKDDTGKKIFETNVKGKNSVEIFPNELNLNVEQKYSWCLDDNAKAYEFTILDAQTEKEILAKLEEIDAEHISDDERILKKSAYVQLISDIYSDKVDLYWLSEQWLSKCSPTDEKLKESKSVLLRKCAHHLDEEM